MKGKHILILSGCILFISAILVALYVSSSLTKDVFRGGFDRKFLPESAVTRKGVSKLENGSYYIAGIANNRVYLGNYKRPLSLVSYDLSLTESTPIKLKIVGLDSIHTPELFRIAVDSPNFFITHGTMPLILRGNLDQWEARPIMPDSNYFFTNAVPMNSNSMALRSYSIKDKGYELAKKTIDSPYFELKSSLLQKQIDGMFCVDGNLSYSKEANRLIYSYYYRNEFIVCDTNLNLLYRGHTIDTFTRAKIQVNDVGLGSSMLSAPPRRINGKNNAIGNHFFVNSNVMAKNQDVNEFLSGSSIDVYDVTTGNYIYSFHIPNYNKASNSDFQINHHSLFIISGQYLVRYEFSPQVKASFAWNKKKK
jgi:hypothetical protein